MKKEETFKESMAKFKTKEEFYDAIDKMFPEFKEVDK